MEENNQNSNGNGKFFRVYLPVIAIAVVVLCAAWYWYHKNSLYITTDDAHLDSDNVSISSKSLGRIFHLYADEGDSVKKGMLLVELDSSDIVAQKNQAIALKAQSEANKYQSEAKYNYDEQSINVLQINFDKAKDDWDRAKQQYSGEVITKEQYDHVKKSYESAQAQIETAKSQLLVSKAQVMTGQAAIENAKAQIGVFETQIRNTRIYAPFDGIVARRWLLAGDIAQPGQSILTLTNTNKLWVIIFLEETKLSGIHVGQKAIFTVDAYPHVKFSGKVFQLGSNTASQFSLIPPNNASGNFTKVSQRVPIKISIDGTENGKKISDYRILSGESVVVKIKRD